MPGNSLTQRHRCGWCEYSPARYRGRMIVFLESAWAIGWLAAAIIAYYIIPKHGWQIAFYIGSLPAILVFYLRRMVPGSVLYLVDKGRYQEAHEQIAAPKVKFASPNYGRANICAAPSAS